MRQPSATLDESRYAYAEAEAQRLLVALSSYTLFDIGAGAAPMRRPFEKLGYRWLGFDLVPKCSGITRWNLDEACPLEIKADLIVMMDVLEHLLNPGIGLSNVVKALAPNGALLLTTPNPRWSRSRLTLLKTGYLNCFTEDDLALNHHVFTPWPHVVFKMISDLGLEVQKFVTLDGKTRLPRPYASYRYPLRLANSLLNKTIEKVDPAACGMSYAITAFRR